MTQIAAAKRMIRSTELDARATVAERVWSLAKRNHDEPLRQMAVAEYAKARRAQRADFHAYAF